MAQDKNAPGMSSRKVRSCSRSRILETGVYCNLCQEGEGHKENENSPPQKRTLRTRKTGGAWDREETTVNARKKRWMGTEKTDEPRPTIAPSAAYLRPPFPPGDLLLVLASSVLYTREGFQKLLKAIRGQPAAAESTSVSLQAEPNS